MKKITDLLEVIAKQETWNDKVESEEELAGLAKGDIYEAYAQGFDAGSVELARTLLDMFNEQK